MQARTAVAGMAVIVVLAVPAFASAAVRYAEPGAGGADPTCPQSDPCDLEEAVELAADGDEIVILTGTYTLADGLSIGGIGTVVHGESNQPRPVLQTSGFTGVALSNTGSTLRHFAIEHTGGGAGLNSIGTVERVTVRSTNAGADVACNLGLSALLRDSTCSTTAGTAPAIRVVESGAFTNAVGLRNVTAVSGGGFGLFARALAGFDLTVDAKATIVRGGAGFADLRAETDGAGSTSTTVNLANSNYASTSTGTTSTITAAGSPTNQTAAPGFVNASAGDFHQIVGSPTINAGAVDSFSGFTDIDGELRTQGSAPDIGADEFDEIAPLVTITAGPAEGETIGASTATFEFAVDDPTAIVRCDLDGAGFGACSGPGNAHTVTGLANGAHVFSVRATDANANTAAATRSFTVAVPPTATPDRDPPETTITKAPPNKTDKVKAKFKFTSDESGSTFECKLDKQPYKPCASPRKYKRLDEGKHKFRVRAIDPAGNVDLTAAKGKWKVTD